MANEESKYDIVKSNEIYEIRKYSDRLAVQALNTDQNNSFRKLFNYISGDNTTNEEIKMTIPVTQMEKKGNMTMQFYLPSKFNKDNVPNPSRSDVEIINIEGGYYAALKYSGRRSDKNFTKHRENYDFEDSKVQSILKSQQSITKEVEKQIEPVKKIITTSIDKSKLD